MKKLNGDTAAVCGLFCGTCPCFLNEECKGCLSDDCCCDCEIGFKICANSNAVERCFECPNFPCDKLEKFSHRHIVNGICHHKNVIEDLKLMKEMGVEKWVEKQTETHTCRKCGKLIVWHETECQCDKKYNV